jgi:aquaporin Z
MKRYAAEAIGTFALVFAGTGAIVIDDLTHAVTHPGIAITFGLVVMAMIYTFGDVSGAHLNPAVTIGFWLSRRLPSRYVAPYIIAQLIGAFVASAALLAMFGNHAALGATIPAGSPWQSFALEAVLTALLMLVILNVSTGPKETGVMAGIAVGGIIGLEAMFAGPICGASMNPARSLAPAVLSGHLAALWVYLIAPILGAAIAVPLWKLTRPTSQQ